MVGDFLLVSARLGFRRWRPEDLDLAAALWGDPQVTRFIGGPASPAAISARLAAEITTEAEVGFQYWPVFQLGDGAHVGCSTRPPASSTPPTSSSPQTVEPPKPPKPPKFFSGF